MKYFISSDIHGFFTIWQNALLNAGYDENNKEHKIVICGDLFDRGNEAKKLLDYLLSKPKDKFILIRGNHEDLLLQCINEILINRGISEHHISNGTLDTISQITGIFSYDFVLGHYDKQVFKENIKPLMKLMKRFVNYYEMKAKDKNYIFVHGWLPVKSNNNVVCYSPSGTFVYNEDWRNASDKDWDKARWLNGMDMNHDNCEADNELVFCGHWHTSYGHSKFENDGVEFGETANFEPYINKGIVALDACTAYSKKVNVYKLDEKDLEK